MIEAMFFKKPNRLPSCAETATTGNNNRSKIRRKKVVVIKSSRSQEQLPKDPSEEEENHHNNMRNNNHHQNGDIELEINSPDEARNSPEAERYSKEEFDERRDEFSQEIAKFSLTDSDCESDKKKKNNKPKHRKTMSMSNTIELVKSVGDELFEAAKREIGEHSKKRENAKKKKESIVNNHDSEKNDVVLLLSDATLGETDDFEIVNMPKLSKKKEAKAAKDAKVASSQITSAQKMGVKMIAKASSVGALSFMKKKRPTPALPANSVDHMLLTTELFLHSERAHSDMVMPKIGKKFAEDSTDSALEQQSEHKSSEEDEHEVFYDAKEDSETPVEEDRVVLSKPTKPPKDSKVIGTRTRKSFGGSLKRTNGGRRRTRRKSSVEDAAPPLPPKNSVGNGNEVFVVPKHSHWLFGSSFKGDGKISTEDGADGTPQLPDLWDKNFDHSADRAEGSHGVRQRPVIRAESYRDKVVKVQRTKRKTSDPNQLTSGNAFNDAEASGNVGAPSGGSSSSSLSSRSNENAGQLEQQDSNSEWSDEEENTQPWSAKAPAELLATMSMKERKRQDLIHELINTESSHVHWLNVLVKVFSSPLYRSNLLTVAEYKALFPNLPDVLQRHKKLSSDLKTLKASAHVVKTKPLAEILINTFGDPKYPVALAKFCSGQRLALDVLKEKQKRNKDLHNFLIKQEQEPSCFRKRLQDFLACVWQRLTKYQLLIEGILKTITDEEDADPDNEDTLRKITYALDLAKDVLQTVDTAVKTTENEHRLRTIQSKLEVRGAGGVTGAESDPGELRRLDLVKHSLVMEGSLLIRQDSTKRLTLHALMLSKCLVLLQKESDKYILRPIPQATHQPLSPVVHWNTVFYRPNAAVKYGFFLVNLNGVQMYDIKVNSSSEYNMWIPLISNAAKALGPRSGTVEEITPPPLPSNPPPVIPINSDDIPADGSEPNTSVEEDRDEPTNVNEDDGTIVSSATRSVEGEVDIEGLPNKIIDNELITPSSVDVICPPLALTAYKQLSPEERLRQAEEKVILALQEASVAAKEVSEVPSSIYSAMETMLGKSYIKDKKRKTSIGNGLNLEESIVPEDISTKNLLLTAQSHVNTLTEVLFRALRVSPSDCAMTKCSVHTSYGLCDTCFAKHSKYLASSKKDKIKSVKVNNDSNENNSEETVTDSNQGSVEQNDNKMDSFVMLEDIGESSSDPAEESDVNLIASSSIGLREILATLLQRLPAEEQERDVLKSRLQQADMRLHLLHDQHKECVSNKDGVEKNNVQETPPNTISNDQSGEG